jgi:hypothetical protein
VAKRALKRREGKINWKQRNWDSISIEKTGQDLSWSTYYRLKTAPPSDPVTTSATLSSTTPSEASSASPSEDCGAAGGSDEGEGEAAEYLDVEDYINRLISENCPHIAAPYVGDCIAPDGTRWLVLCTCVCVCVCVCVRARQMARVGWCYLYVCICVCVFVCLFLCVCVCIHMYV